MAKKTIDMIVAKRLKWHETEIILLWLIIAMAAIPIPAGIGIYFCVDNLSITQYTLSLPAQDFVTSQVRMLCNFGTGLGVVFALVGIATIALAVNRLSLARDAWRMASFIGSETREEWKLDS